ncbi:MAG: hypothetical protein Q9163_004327 [Psora crenata]
MQARYAKGLLTPSSYYVCLSCRLRIAAVSNGRGQRYQHTQDSNSTEKQDVSASFSEAAHKEKANTLSTGDNVAIVSDKPQEEVQHSDLNDKPSFGSEDRTQIVLQQKYVDQRQELLAAYRDSAHQSKPLSKSAKTDASSIGSKGEEARKGPVKSARRLKPSQRRKLRRNKKLRKVSPQGKQTPQSSKAASEHGDIPTVLEVTSGQAQPEEDERSNEPHEAEGAPTIEAVETPENQAILDISVGKDVASDVNEQTALKQDAKTSAGAKAAPAKKEKTSTSPGPLVAGKPGKVKIKKVQQKELVRKYSATPKEELVQRLTSQIAVLQAELEKNASVGHPKELKKTQADLQRRKAKLKGLASDTNNKDSVKQNGDHLKQPVRKTGRSRSNSKRMASSIEKTDASGLKIQPIEVDQLPVPKLAYGLERVLFNPGVYQLQDPRSRVYNFDPYLQNIMPVADFDFNALKEYITSSRDESLKAIARQHDKRYVGSTSSMTGILAHFHFLLSQWRPINTSMLSKNFPVQHSNFTELQRCPSAIFLRWQDGTYAIDADKEFANANILSMLGKSMEKLLTLKTDDFERYRKSSPGQVSEEEQLTPESYHYSTLGDFLMRSQLDAHDSRLPGTGMFDLKTRAVVSIRMDVQNYEQGVGYQIKDRHGAYESYEREYYDMIRAAFLKYSMQVRMGRMDGIFVAYHNVERIFGFQYISLNEMDTTIHGQWETSIGDQEFVLSLNLLNKILNKATKKFPETSLRIHFETRDAATPFMYIFAEPVTEAEVAKIQSSNDAKIHEFESRILGLKRDNDNQQQEDDPRWADIEANVQEAMDKDELGLEDPAEEQSESTEGMVEHPDDHGLFEESHLLADEALKGSGDGANAVAPSDATNAAEDNDGVGVEQGDDEEVEEDNEESDDEDAEQHGERKGEGEDDDKETVKDHPDSVGENQKGDESEMTSDETAPVQGCEDILEHDPAASKVARGHNAENHYTASETGSVASREQNQDQQEPPAAPHGELPFEKPEGFETEADTPFIEELDQATTGEDAATSTKDILAMTLTIRNKVNNAFVLRPENLTPSDAWSIEYSLTEVPDGHRAWALYEACQARRKKKLDAPMPQEDAEVVSYYVRNLRKLSERGREWREEMDRRDSEKPLRVLGRDMEKSLGANRGGNSSEQSSDG